MLAALSRDRTDAPRRRSPRRALRAMLISLAVLAGGVATPAAAEPEKCPRMVAQRPTPVRLAALEKVERASDFSTLRFVQAEEGKVRLTFVGHATFLIESPKGVTIATDYNDYVRPAIVPLVATMNRAHDTHYTEHPDPGIAHVLRGWGSESNPAHHELTLDDVWIRNVPTNVRRGAGTYYDGNSIFVFEVAGVCIAHLGHLHHLLTPDHLEALGRIDVVLAPVDGSYTLDLEGMVETLKAINAPLIVPMHYFSTWGLDRFLGRLGKEYKIESNGSPTVYLSRTSLPRTPTVLVLEGR